MKTDGCPPVPVFNTAEEALEWVFPKREAEIAKIESRLDEIKLELETAKDAEADTLCEPGREADYRRAVQWVRELRKERAELRKRLKELNG